MASASFSVWEYRFSTSVKARLAYATTFSSFCSVDFWERMAETPTGLASNVTINNLFKVPTIILRPLQEIWRLTLYKDHLRMSLSVCQNMPCILQKTGLLSDHQTLFDGLASTQIWYFSLSSRVVDLLQSQN